MRTVALISGGKDSCYNMMCCIAENHDVVALANLRPAEKDELDSYMFQTVGHHAINLYAEATGLPLYVETITGSSLSTERYYLPKEGDEVEDLYTLLSRVKEAENIEAVSVGAILSDYQRVRVENVCQRLGLVVLAYLWQREQAALLAEMVEAGVKAVIIKVAALGLTPDKHLGMELKDIYPHMLKMRKEYGLNECGEGGEYETFVFDCPVFKKSIVIGETEKVIHLDDAFAPVGYLNLKNCTLQEKCWNDDEPLKEKLSDKIFTSKQWNENLQSLSESDVHENKTEDNDALKNNISDSSKMNLRCHSDGERFVMSGIRPSAVDGEDVKTLTGRAMDSMIDAIEKLGHNKKEILSVSLYVKDLSCFAAINSVYKTYFDINPPVRLCVSACLPSNSVLQMDCQGCRVPDSVLSPGHRATLHVQSLSHWAPANIGPYSQATCIGRKLYMAGIVPLVPSSLEVVPGGIRAQCVAALQHVATVMQGLWPVAALTSCPLTLCYVTKSCHISEAEKHWMQALDNDLATPPAIPPRQPRLQCVVVPALPKGCLVEWQPCIWAPPTQTPEVGEEEEEEKEDFSLYKDFSDVSSNSNNWTLEVNCVSSKQNQALFSSHITASLQTDKISGDVDKTEAEALSIAVVEQYHKACTALHRGDDFLPLVKVFFLASVYTTSQLQDGFEKALTKMDIKHSPVISFVPVQALQSPNQHLAWCQV